MRKRKERAKEREMESSRERSLKWRGERKRVWRGWSRAREREKAQAHVSMLQGWPGGS